MGIMDSLGEHARKHEQQIEGAIEKGGDAIDKVTGGKFVGQVDKGQEYLNERLDSLTGSKDQQEVAQSQDQPQAGQQAPEAPSA